MWKYLFKINQNLVIAIPAVMILGFVYGTFFDAKILKKLIIFMTFLMVYPMMVTLNFKKLLEGGDTKTQLLAQLINFGVLPFIAFFAGKIFFADMPYVALGLLLTFLLPTSGMTITWTGLAKGNLESAVKMTVIGLTLGSIATPFYIKFLMGTTVDVNMIYILKQIVIVVFIPMILGFITRTYVISKVGMEAFKERVSKKFSSTSIIGVLGIIFIAISIMARDLVASPKILFYILIPLILLYVINFAISTIVGKLMLPRGDAIALVYGTVLRNLSIALAIAINSFGSAGAEISLIISTAYIIQSQMAAWYIRFTYKIFGKIN